MSATGSEDRPAPLAAGLERYLNRRLAESTAAREKAVAVGASTFRLVIRGTGLLFVLSVEDGQYRVSADAAAVTDVTVHATPLGLLTLVRSSSLTSLKQADASIEGKIHVAEAYSDALSFAKPDAEALLAGWVGDIAAHAIVRQGRAGIEWLARVQRAMEQNAAEFLTEEQPMLARSAEVREFADRVDETRDDVERLAARVDRLHKRTRA